MYAYTRKTYGDLTLYSITTAHGTFVAESKQEAQDLAQAASTRAMKAQWAEEQRRALIRRGLLDGRTAWL